MVDIPENAVVREFKPTLHHELLQALKSDNPILAAIINLPEFQEQLEEQNELLKIVSLRRKLSVADELVDGAVEEIMAAAEMLAGLFLSNVAMSKATGMRTLDIETKQGHLKIVYTPPFGSAHK
jgi:hypothetical protein